MPSGLCSLFEPGRRDGTGPREIYRESSVSSTSSATAEDLLRTLPMTGYKAFPLPTHPRVTPLWPCPLLRERGRRWGGLGLPSA
jgi:hypothetical protein